MSCTACGSELAEGARFCSACGTEVIAGHDERRIATILFADLVDFTALAERLDPEQVKRFIDSCFEVLVADIESYGGRVDKILGDGVLAMFGAPISHEDDAERAVRCALRMHHSLAEAVESSPEAIGADGVQMRIGVNTGEVLVGSLAGTDYTAMGDVVNTASRLQVAAPAGRVLVGETTEALTRESISYEPAGMLIPRGREQAVQTWVAIEPIAPPGARHRVSSTPLVGRHHELSVVDAAQALAESHGRGLLVSITGEGGVGKTRLLHEIGSRFRSARPGLVLHGACVPYGEANSWWPIATVLGEALQVPPQATAQQARELVKLRLDQLPTAMEPDTQRAVTEAVLRVLGLPSTVDRLDASSLRSAVHQPLSRLFYALSQEQPLAITVDDVHWASAGVMELLDVLIDTLDRLAVLLVIARRPDADSTWTPSVVRTTAVAFELQPLGRADTLALSTNLLGERARDTQLLNTIYERSGGNPLFVHEFAALATSGETVPVLPDTLRTIIGARLDQLPRDERQILDNAATLGLSGSVESLRTFAEHTGQTFDRAALARLRGRGLLDVIDGRWWFFSDSVRDTAYTTMSKTARAQRHAGVARVLAAAPTPSLDDLAHHTATAAKLLGELGQVSGVPPTIVDDAIRLVSEAARRAAQLGNFRIAVRQAGRGLELLSPHPTQQPLRHDLLLVRAGAALELRQFAQARADVDEVLATVGLPAELPRWAEAMRILGALQHAMGDQAAARAALGQAVDVLRQAGVPEQLARTLRSRGFIELFNGSLIDAEWFFGEADALYAELGDSSGQAWIEQHRALAAFLGGDLDAARSRLDAVAKELGELGDHNGAGWANGLLAFVSFYECDSATAEGLATAVSLEAEERGDDWAVGMMLTLRAHIALWRGHLGNGLKLAESARHAFRRLGDPFGTTQALSALVRIQVALGEFDGAQRTGEELKALAESSPLGSFPLLSIAGSAMHRGMAGAALVNAELAAEAMRGAHIRAFEPDVVRAVAMAQLGRDDEALVALDSLDRRGAQHPFAQAASSLVLALTGDAGGALDCAAAVLAHPGSSYLDRTFADLAAASAHAQRANRDAAKESARAALQRANEVGDVIAVALAQWVSAGLDGATPAGELPLSRGWSDLLARLPLSS